MKKIIFFLTVSIVIFSSFKPKNQYGDVPQKIIVVGKIDNYDSNRQLTLSVNYIGFEQKEIFAKTDGAGNFIATFESYIPVDVWLRYKTNFLVLLHPGDSLFVQFDGRYNNRPQILETVVFGGNAAQTNQYAAKFQQMYFSNEIYNDWNKKNRAVKEYDADRYIQYLDTILQKSREIYDQFVAENQPNDESKKWAQLYIEGCYYDELGQYARNHRRANNMENNNKWDVPKGFYDRLLNRLPIDTSMFICSHQISIFSDRFLSTYFNDILNEKFKNLRITDILSIRKKADEIRFSTISEFTLDPLLRQIMLTKMLSEELEEQNINNYERFNDLVNTYITEPFLKEPLHPMYLQTKARIKNPKIYTEAVLKEAADFSIKQIVDNILQQNKGRVIYIDFWATWCGACLEEMPNSKTVELELKKKNVAFVYICLNSDEERWKSVLDKYQIGGQHYLLSGRQSGEIKSLFEINAVPDYMLIDKNGVIKEKGSHLRPLVAKEKIMEML